MQGRSGDRHTHAHPVHRALMIAREVDTTGTHCPGPLMEAIRLVRESEPGDTIAVIAADPAAGESIPTWVAKAGHRLHIEELGARRRYVITRSR